MFRIRAIYDDLHPQNKNALKAAQQILRDQFPGLSDEDIDSVREQLLNPFTKRFKTVLLVAEGAHGQVQGFAILMQDPSVPFCFLDFIASARGITSRGIGGALYDRVREEAVALDAKGLFFECAPDDPEACSTRELAQQNAARFRFYENWGARPIIDTDYERPLTPGAKDMPHLVYDDLGSGLPLSRQTATRVMRAVLERKYVGLCPPEYVSEVLRSVRDEPVHLRPLRYVRQPRGRGVESAKLAPLVINDQHDIHHVRDRGYVEAPVRVSALLRELEPLGAFEKVAAREHGDRHLLAVHDGDFIDYLKKACAGVPANRSVYPYVFPVRNATRPPKDLAIRAGYYCIDTFTPLNANAWLAARRAVDCALTAADSVARGAKYAYALVRPPGHHAERRLFGGFCYMNNAAVAAHRLSTLGRVAILDVDYHHGNGQQQIFYNRRDVLTVSVHGHPSFAYPYFSGFPEERGDGEGEGFNLNLAQPEKLDGTGYARALARALKAVADYRPDFVVVALGLDTARGDPTGSWTLNGDDFENNGRSIKQLNRPTLVVQEGGYRTRSLGVNARKFFNGLLS